MLKNRLLLIICTLTLILVSCHKNENAAADNAAKQPQSEAELKGLKVAYNSGSIYDLMMSQRDDITALGFNMQSDCIQAVIRGQADIMVDDDTFLPPEEMKRLGLKLAFRGETKYPCGFGLRKGDTELRDQLSYFIDSLQSNGELQQMYEKWYHCDTPSRLTLPDMGPAPTGDPIHIGFSANLPPTSFPVEDAWNGFEPELLERFARFAGRPVDYVYIPSGSSIAALQARNIDILGGGIFITEERLKSIDFTSSHFNAYAGYFVKASAAEQHLTFGQRIKKMYHNNLVVENRWRFITDGLWETVKISVFAILLGSLLGAGVCWMRMSRRKWLSVTAKVYVDLMRGIPMLVFLMIMFYVVLSSTGMSASAVAIVAFALNFAAYVSEMFRTAITGVSKGQTEAGLAIGFTRWQTFVHIVAPQALRSVMPVYKGEAVSLVKNTSIVGYIAIQDLTRASDMIRNRTFDAFFPLLIVTIIYFILAWLLGKLLDLTVREKKTTKTKTVSAN